MYVRPTRLLGIGKLILFPIKALFWLLKGIYKGLAYLKLRLFALYMLVFGILVWTNVVPRGENWYKAMIFFAVVLFLGSLVVFVKVRGKEEKGEKPAKNKKKEKKKAEKQEPLQEVSQETPDALPAAPEFPEDLPADPVSGETPRFYRVAEDPRYVMAEYSDRIELFFKTPEGYRYVRTDRK